MCQKFNKQRRQPGYWCYRFISVSILVASEQCDQIWQNFTLLARCCNTLAISKRFIGYFVILRTYFGIFMVLGKYSVWQMAKYWTNKLAVWSHWSQQQCLGKIKCHFLCECDTQRTIVQSGVQILLTENTNLRRSMTVRMNSCLFGLDSAALLIFN